ncbi:MAG: N-6 DNA methylase, partial [Bacteroidetes bacterium]|nr:N-6 DNA methylase [Bacteroidota bacterium]
MTTADINKILSQLAATPSRDNVLDFAFALLQWMNITPNAGQKPQLISPQTQKLKDFLATAPQTVQPQLYRLSADNQNIRVRFAVLKKLKKDYISQLVDNDPGLGSYQSMIKGITTNNKGFVPSQPYFIHFVTTPDYDKLVLVFNQGEQKRIVSFRNRLTSTQYNKIILQWQGVGTKSKPEIADLLWKSLDIKEVNKEFYKQIKERFDALLGIVKTQDAVATESQVKQFSVRLIGRYIFCWFLKEKGIIPTSLISSDAIRNTENYYQSILLPLFFKTLNTKVQDREILKSCNPKNQGSDNIPYLNGGLFDESNEDKLFTTLNLDAWLLPFVEILESYDFTVDESSSQYQQVAVDPEMLGRIFENLLASQNEETEKLANQRKAFGAFYTPREIVDYMVNESLKAYLQTQWEGEGEKVKEKSEKWKEEIEKKVEPLFNVNVEVSHLKKEEKTLLLSFLEKIKILDPACGSGAFPMGILQKLVELHEALGTVKSRYKLKKDILSRNIHGVDIMPMAIEIARLRAWLSLVLEETYNPKDPVHNFGVKPLPNLDFKFVCANSLIDSGYDDFLKKLALSNGVPTLMRMHDKIQELEKIRNEYYDTEGNQEKRDLLRNEFMATKDYIKTEFNSLRKSWALDAFFNKIDDWNPFDDSHASTFFSPSWMFGIDKGFDVVIGNPPYVQMQKNSGFLAEQLKSAGYFTYERTGDVYAIFYEFGFKVLREKGVHTFITSSQWLKAAYGKSLRKLFLSKNPIKLIALGPGVFESAVVDTNILIAKNNENENRLVGSVVDNPEQLNQLNNLQYNPMPYVTVEKWAIMDDGKQTLFRKIKSKGKSLKNWSLKINRGVLTGFNKAFIIDEATRNELVKADEKNTEVIRPILRGREIEKYFTHWEGEYLINTHNGVKSKKIKRVDISKYPNLRKYLDSFQEKLEQRLDQGDTIYNLRNCAYLDEFSKEKIIWKRIGSQLRFSYSDGEIYCLDSTCIATGEKIKYLTALLNSKLCNYQLFESAPRTGMGDLIISVQALEPLLVYYPTDKEEKQIENLVDKILKKKKANQDTTPLEKEIDVL